MVYSKIPSPSLPLINEINLTSVFENCKVTVRPFANSIYNCHYTEGINVLTRHHLTLSHLYSYKSKYGLQDSLHIFFSAASLGAERSVFPNKVSQIVRQHFVEIH